VFNIIYYIYYSYYEVTAERRQVLADWHPSLTAAAYVDVHVAYKASFAAARFEQHFEVVAPLLSRVHSYWPLAGTEVYHSTIAGRNNTLQREADPRQLFYTQGLSDFDQVWPKNVAT